MLAVSHTKPAIRRSLSVIIPITEFCLFDQTLESVVQQVGVQKLQIIVIDNASGIDQSRIERRFRKISLKDDRLRRIEKSNMAVACNTGARLAIHPYLVFLLPSILLDTDFFTSLCDELEAAEDNVSYAYSDYIVDHPEKGAQTYHSRHWDLNYLLVGNFVPPVALIRKEQFPGFDEEFDQYETWGLWLKMAEKGLRGEYLEKVLFTVVSAGMTQETSSSTLLHRQKILEAYEHLRILRP